MKKAALRTVVVLACLVLTAGCGTTTISREDQLALRNSTSTAVQTTEEIMASDPLDFPETTGETAADTTAADPAGSTEPVPESSGATEFAAASTAPAPVTKPTTSPATKPSAESTAAPTAVPTAAPTTAPTEAPPETTQTPAVEPDDPYDISDHQVGALEYEILAEINARRTESGLAALTMDTRLAAISSVRAYECSIDFSHTRPDGRDCFTALDDYGYRWQHAVGENLLCGSAEMSASGMVEAWMNSEGHRENILCEDFTAAGIGVYVTGGTIYVANFFVG